MTGPTGITTADPPQWRPGVTARLTRAPILRGAWARDERFLQFLAFGLPFDHEHARSELDRIEASRVAWLDAHGPSALTHAELVDLLGLAVEAALEPHRGADLTFGLSGGFDSRPLLHMLWKRGLQPALYTFGSPGNIDFDLVHLLDERLSLSVRFFDSNVLEWSLEVLDEHALTTNDFPISPRVLAARAMDADHPGRVEVHGFFNDVLTGGTRSQAKRYREDDIGAFLAKNDPFRLQDSLSPRVVRDTLARSVVSKQRGMSTYRQLEVGYRQMQRILPGADEPIQFIYPYADDRWVGYWLNRPADELSHQRRWIEFIRELDRELFFEIQGIDDVEWAFNRARLQRLYGDDDHPGLVDFTSLNLVRPSNPKNHFNILVCYRNNASFAHMVDESIRRVRGRRVFREGFVDHVVSAFVDGEAAAIAQLNGLVSADVAIEAGRF